MNLNCRRIAAFVIKIHNHFLDTPSVTLTLSQAQRRFGLDEITCDAVLNALVEARVLARTSEGAYVRFFPRNAVRTCFAA